MAPDRFFQKIKPENRGPFYAIVGLLGFALVVIVLLAMSQAPPEDKDTYMKVIGLGCGLMGILYLVIRQDRFASYMHQSNHALKEDHQAVVSAANLAEREATKAAEAAKEVKQEVKQKLNGGLHEAVRDELSKTLTPIVEANSIDCDKIALRTVELFTDKLRDEGILPRKP